MRDSSPSLESQIPPPENHPKHTTIEKNASNSPPPQIHMYVISPRTRILEFTLGNIISQRTCHILCVPHIDATISVRHTSMPHYLCATHQCLHPKQMLQSLDASHERMPQSPCTIHECHNYSYVYTAHNATNPCGSYISKYFACNPWKHIKLSFHAWRKFKYWC